MSSGVGRSLTVLFLDIGYVFQHDLSIRKHCPQVEMAAHRFDIAPQRTEVHVGALFGFRDSALVDNKISLKGRISRRDKENPMNLPTPVRSP